MTKKLFRGITVDNPLGVWLLNFSIFGLTLSCLILLLRQRNGERRIPRRNRGAQKKKDSVA